MGAPRPKTPELIGKGRPVILYHGAYLSSILWQPIVPILARSCQVLAPDLPGHGESEETTTDLSEYTRSLLGKLGLDRASFIGSSFGGGALIRFAAAHPEKVERLVLVSPTGIPAVENDAETRKFSKPRDLFEAFQRSIHDPKLATRALYRKIMQLQRKSGPYIERYRASLPKGYRERGWIPEMKRIQVPTLVVWGDEDQIVPFVFAERLTGTIPGARLNVMKGTGHFPYFERPEEFASIVEPFLNR